MNSERSLFIDVVVTFIAKHLRRRDVRFAISELVSIAVVVMSRTAKDMKIALGRSLVERIPEVRDIVLDIAPAK